MDGHIDMALVKEFYANLYDPEDKSPRQVRVRGKLIKFDTESLNSFLETPVVLEPGEHYTTCTSFCGTRLEPQEFTARLCILGRGFMLNVEGAPEAPEEGSHYTSPDMECVIILQPRHHFSHVRSKYGQGEVSLWASHKDGHGLGLAHIRPDLTDGPVQLLAARLPISHHRLMRRPRSYLRLPHI